MRTLVENIDIRRGDDHAWWSVLEDQTTELPIDISSGSVEFMVKSSYSDDDTSAIIDLSVGSGITLETYTDENDANYADAKIIIRLTNAQTALLINDSYVYDLTYNNAAGQRYTAITGTITILSQVNQGH